LGGVDIEIAGRHIEVTEPMRSHVGKCIEKLSHYAEIIQHMTVTLGKDPGGSLVEILAKCPRADLVVQAKGHDMYASIDEAFSKIEHRLTRYHDKLVKSRARRGHKAAEVDKEPQ
jgi:putative sigma-54 modulation protein